MDEVIAYFYPSEESHHNFQYSNALLLQEMATTASGITPQERLPAQPMAIHSGLRRKHRKNAGTRLSPKVSAALRGKRLYFYSVRKIAPSTTQQTPHTDTAHFIIEAMLENHMGADQVGVTAMAKHLFRLIFPNAEPILIKSLRIGEYKNLVLLLGCKRRKLFPIFSHTLIVGIFVCKNRGRCEKKEFVKNCEHLQDFECSSDGSHHASWWLFQVLFAIILSINSVMTL